ncbi:hypothetical protein ACE6H2_009240 [Prunus campanulata]
MADLVPFAVPDTKTKRGLAVAISVIRVLLFVARPMTFVQGNLPNSMVYRNVEQYPNVSNVPRIFICLRLMLPFTLQIPTT